MHPLMQNLLHKKQCDVEALTQSARSPNQGLFTQALSQPGFHVVAEFKRAAPSKGHLCDTVNLEQQVQQYMAGGASVLSVLTEHHYFNGSIDDYQRVAQLAHTATTRPTPVLRKDFIIDVAQIYQSAQLHCDAILLIAGLVSERLADLYYTACQVGLDVLVEVHTQAELEAALALGAPCIGINNRNLHTLTVDNEHALRLHQHVFQGAHAHAKPPVLIAESGIGSIEDAARYRNAGFSGILVGSLLMGAHDVAGCVRALRGQPA